MLYVSKLSNEEIFTIVFDSNSGQWWDIKAMSTQIEEKLLQLNGETRSADDIENIIEKRLANEPIDVIIADLMAEKLEIF